MDRKATVPTGARPGVKDCTTAPRMTTPSATASTRLGAYRSESQPPIGRISTASRTNPAIRFAASAGARPYAVLR